VSRRRPTLAAVLLAGLLLGGCAVGPSYRPEPAVPAASRVGGGGPDTTTRRFFDSLATARAADSAASDTVASVPLRLPADSGVGAAWLDLFRDSTLVRLVETAVRQNRDVQGAVARIREFRALVGVARAPLFPTVTVNGSASTNQSVFGSFPPSRFDAIRVTGDLAWELDFWGRIRRGLQAAQADLSAQEASQRAVLLTLVSDVASGYLQLLQLDEERSIAARTLASRQEVLKLAQRRFDQGVISELDVRQFEAQVAVAASALAVAERDGAQREHQLSVLLGQAPTAVPRGGSLVQAVSALKVPDSIPATLVARRPDVQQAERGYAAATARIGAAQAARLPTFSITGSYGSQATGTSNLFDSSREVYQLQGAISVPIFTGGLLSNQAGAARARAEQARAQYEQTVLVALGEAGDALVGVRTAHDITAAQQTQAQALRRALELAERRYISGVASYVEVLDAQRSLFDAELSLSRARLQELDAAVELYRSIGGSWTRAR
jgi:multidrug efflux system outer membrane protein